MTRRLALLAAIALPVAAHMVSMSTGEARLEGARLVYNLSVPLYELTHIKNPEQALLANIHFSSAGVEARVVDKACRADVADAAYVCSATYEFPEPVERFQVECTFHAVTVPNHVHLLRASMGSKTDQAVFDFSFTKADLRFAPPTTFELITSQAMAGAFRACGGLAQMLFLLVLVLAARSRRELLALAGMLIIGEAAACVVAPRLGVQLSPRFVEAAAALTVAYLAAEILLLPEAHKRWLIVGVLGVFHGLSLEMFIRASGYRSPFVLSGVIVAELTIIAALALLLGQVRRATSSPLVVRVPAALCALVGAVWFGLRLAS
ncbi:MAG: HupE/UreJ family protein [Acidobacteriales bacterium]|nr:HupE/UreJ family protein [Terriglobales bacterium]